MVRGTRVPPFIRRTIRFLRRSAARTCRRRARVALGRRKPCGSTVAAAFRLTGTRFPRGKRPRRTDARAVPKLFATVRTFPPTRTLRFTCVPTRAAAPPTRMVGPVLRLPCGPATWLLSISSPSPTAIRGSASSIQLFTRLVWARATQPISTTSPAEATDTLQQLATTWPPAGVVRMDPPCSTRWLGARRFLALAFLPRPLQSR